MCSTAHCKKRKTILLIKKKFTIQKKIDQKEHLIFRSIGSIEMRILQVRHQTHTNQSLHYFVNKSRAMKA